MDEEQIHIRNSDTHQPDMGRIKEAVQHFALFSSMTPSSWKIRFAPRKGRVSCNLCIYFRNRKIVRATASGEDEHAALDNCLLKLGTGTDWTENYALLGNG